MSHTFPAADVDSTASTARNVHASFHSVSTQFHRGIAISSPTCSALHALATKMCDSCGLTRRANHDLEEIYNFIAQDNRVAARRLISELEQECKRLSKSPAIGRARDELSPSLRSFPVGKYIIFYRPEEDSISIIRVLHGARDIDLLFD